MSFNIEVAGGSSVRLPTAGKYCDRDIVVTASGGGGGGATCKLKVVASNYEEYGYMLSGTLYVPGYEDINLSTIIGTTEYEVPCDAIVVAYSYNGYIASSKNVTDIIGEPTWGIRVTAEAGGEAVVCFSAYC